MGQTAAQLGAKIGDSEVVQCVYRRLWHRILGSLAAAIIIKRATNQSRDARGQFRRVGRRKKISSTILVLVTTMPCSGMARKELVNAPMPTDERVCPETR
jgi:hypothetical protein